MIDSIRKILMTRDDLSAEEADKEILAAKCDLAQRLKAGEMPFDICAEWFGLEEDYLMELSENL